MSSTETSVDDQARPQKIEADRLSFDETLLKKTEEFVESVLKSVPELGGLAIVPVWTNPTDNLPPALLRLRNPNEPPMAAMLQLIQNMSKFSLILDKTLIEQYRFFDSRVRELAQRFEEIQTKTPGAKPQE
jgi:hypothetical protein